MSINIRMILYMEKLEKTVIKLHCTGSAVILRIKGKI